MTTQHTLAIAPTWKRAEALAERHANGGSYRAVRYGTMLGGMPFTAAYIELPAHGLTADDVAWIEHGVLTRLHPGVHLVIRTQP